MRPICKLKRVNAPSSPSSTTSKAVEEEIKKRLEERKKQDEFFRFPTVPLTSPSHTPSLLRG